MTHGEGGRMSDEHLIAACSALVPDATFLAAGAFQPRGTQLATAMGPAGVFAGWFLAKTEDVPRYAIVGVTESEVVLFRAPAARVGWKPEEIVGRFPRSAARMSSGVMVRKLTIESGGGADLKLESPRIGPWHGAAVAKVLS
jgi:hypothetical protein